MKILENERKNYTVYLKILLSPEDISAGMDAAFTHLVKSARVPGFRPGKVPRKIYEEAYGQQKLIEFGYQQAIGKGYDAAIKELDLKVIDQPKNFESKEPTSTNEYEFSCEVDVQPEVILGQYRGLTVEKPHRTASESDIDAEIARMLQGYGTYVSTESPIKNADLVRANLVAKSDGNRIDEWCIDGIGLTIGNNKLGESFDAQLIGKTAGDTAEFSIDYDSTHPTAEMAGKTIEFSVEITDVRESKLPDITDEFVQDHFDKTSVGELREAILKDLNERFEAEDHRTYLTNMVETVNANSEVAVPPILVNQRLEEIYAEQKAHFERIGFSMARLLEIRELSEAEYIEPFRPTAERDVKFDLILDAIIRAEEISVSTDDLNAEVHRMSNGTIDNVEHLKKLAKKSKRIVNYDVLKQRVAREKARLLIVESLNS